MHDSTAQSPTLISRGRLRWTGLAFILFLIVVVSLGILRRESDARRLKNWTSAQAVPTVRVTRVEGRTADTTLELPGRIEAYARAPIYARVSGYLKSWSADIGTHVEAGQPLAVIEVPDLDQELAQAKADLASARANSDLARKTAQRWESLVGSGLVSRQDTDQKISDLAAKVAEMKAAAANVGRIEAMKRYAHIVAPFDGIVTARNTDVGQLINAGDNGQGHELFVVSDVHRLRIYVQVPQADAPSIVDGATATLTVPGYPGRQFAATVEASAGAINASSGSTLVQLIMNNPGEEMLPGSFAMARFHLATNRAGLLVPADALMFDEHGLRVATVDTANRVIFRKVSIAHDYGNSVQIASGLVTGDRVIDNPPDSLSDGDRIQVVSRDEENEPRPKLADPGETSMAAKNSNARATPPSRGIPAPEEQDQSGPELMRRLHR